MMFGLTLAPLLFLVGAAIDFGVASNVRTSLQRGTDGTSLQLCQLPKTTTAAQLKQAANRMMSAYMGSVSYNIDALDVTANPRRISLATSTIYETAVARAFGAAFAEVPMSVRATCENAQQTFEIALVLDNTGSMDQSAGGVSKMDALKDAATTFVKFVYATPKLSAAKISLVPFAAAVAVNPTTYRNATWIDQKGKASYHWNGLQGGAASVGGLGTGIKSRLDLLTQLKASQASWDWTGCIESLAYPYNTRDGLPISGAADSYYVPMFAVDASGNGGAATGSYLDDQGNGCLAPADEASKIGNACKYKAVKNPQTKYKDDAVGPNTSCTTRPLTRLTENTSTLLNEISLMQPNGSTNTHEGFMWGWRTLSPTSVFADGVPYNTAYNNKIIILMTDGTNTWNTSGSNATLKSDYSAYGYFANPDGTGPSNRFPSGTSVTNSSQARTAMDNLMLEACRNAATAPSNVQIYTIGFSVAGHPIDQTGINMLKSCAGSPDRAFIANDSNGLMNVFQQIANNIGQLRLTN